MKKLWKVNYTLSFSEDEDWLEEETIEDVIKVVKMKKPDRTILKIEMMSKNGILR